jgi:predicted phage terminase large subunit-like protein
VRKAPAARVKAPSGADTIKIEDLDFMLANLDQYTAEEKEELLQTLEAMEHKRQASSCYDDLLTFCKAMQPDYLVGKHHKILASLLMMLESGEKTRICVNIAPRHGKSSLVSLYFPAWYLGRNPTKKVMMVSHTTDLAVDFGRKVRNVIASAAYHAIFPDVKIAQDSKSAGRWNTNVGGEYYACGVGSSIAGRGADLLLIDDPHSEQDVLNGNFEVFARAYEWYAYGARTRLMPGGRVAIVQTRWHADDLTGRVTKDMAMNPDADQFEVVEFPAVMEVERVDPVTGLKKIEEKALWPEFFDMPALIKTRASMPSFQWSAQYQQKPTSEEGALVKRSWWRIWPKEDPPKLEYMIMTLDAAAESHNRADFTAITTWGVFFHEPENAYHIILLNSIKKRLEFPELKTLAMAEFTLWKPDSFIVEKKSSGTALFQELRRMGVYVSEYTPHRGSGDKTARLNSVADIVRSGLVWVPDVRWADELIDEVAAFPFASNDDLVDTTVMALMRFRQGGFIRLPTDEKEDEKTFKSRKRKYY